MTIPKHTVVVKQLPALLNAKQGRRFFREIEACMNVDRPRMVLDCSTVQRMDKPVAFLMLCCLEEAMKGNGDVKLAALPPGPRAILEITGINRLFDIYETTADAVNSFHHPGTGVVEQTSLHVRDRQEPNNAA